MVLHKSERKRHEGRPDIIYTNAYHKQKGLNPSRHVHGVHGVRVFVQLAKLTSVETIRRKNCRTVLLRRRLVKPTMIAGGAEVEAQGRSTHAAPLHIEAYAE